MNQAQFTKPKLKDLADLNDLVVEVARVDVLIGQAKSDYDTAKAKLDQVDAERRLIEVPPTTAKGKPKTLTLTQYREDLVARAEAYCLANPDAAMADGKKSRTYPAGVVAWKKDPDKIEVRDPEKLAKARKTIGELIAGALAKLVLWKTQEGATALKIIKAFKLTKKGAEAELDPGSIQKGINAKDFTPAVLGMVGMELVEGQDRLTIKPNAKTPD